MWFSITSMYNRVTVNHPVYKDVMGQLTLYHDRNVQGQMIP